ncbi:maltose/maltodextrin ABC transporter [Cutibacterium acnes JCM 18916]|nr:maltose/maltodextrin ABC transporter [Cutibacterium acnes JCM 18916]
MTRGIGESPHHVVIVNHQSQGPRKKRVAAASGKYSGSLWAWITKIALLGILDAIAVYGVMTAIAHSSPLMAIVIAAVAIIVTVIYLPPNRMLPAKYLHRASSSWLSSR